MSSNLTISYTSQTAAGITPAGASAADIPAADSPLGFLAALIDQLLAGGGEAVAKPASAEAGADVSVPGLLTLPLNTKTETKIAASPDGADLLAALTHQLDALQSQLDLGESPAPGQLKKLNDAIDTLAAAIAAPPVAPQIDATMALDPLKAISADVTVETAEPATQPSTGDDPVSQLLASLGLTAPKETEAAPKPAPQTVEIVTELRDRVLALSQSLAATSPAMSQKLEALATKLTAVEADPQLVAQFTTAPPNEDALIIAKVIRALLGATPAAPVAGEDTETSDAPVANPAPPAPDQLLQVLATLGVNPPPTDTTAASTATTDISIVAVAPTPTVGAPPPLVRLSTQLSKLSSELADEAPELAQKLDAIATKLLAPETDPNLFGKITSAAAQRDGTALGKLVQNLIEPKPTVPPPPTAPQIAAAAELQIPAPIAPTQSKSAIAEVKATPPQPTPVTADSAPVPEPSVKIATVEVAAKAVEGDPQPKTEAKIVAEIVKANAPEPAPSPQQPAATPPVFAANQARPLPTAYQPVANPINMGQVAFEMVRQVHQGNSRFTIRLDPPEMGRVDVRMHVDQSGIVNARLTVDRAETLDMFQRDQRSLERALSQAGLDSSKTNLEFSLRQNPFAGMAGGDQRQQQHGLDNGTRFSLSESDEQVVMPAITLYRGTASAGGVNIFA